jgi:hypothetical protein
MRAEIDAAIKANPDLKGAMPFGPMGFGPGGHGRHGGPGMMMRFDLEEKLGMTKEEIKAELDSGKTIEQIAEEHGVTLPARPPFGGPMR